MRATSILIALAAFSLPTSALACSCMPQSVPQQVKAAEYIFIGKPQRTEIVKNQDRVTSFRIDEMLKGKPAKGIRIFHYQNDGGNCGVSFQRGKRMLMTARRSEGRLFVNSCTMPYGTEAEFRAATAKK